MDDRRTPTGWVVQEQGNVDRQNNSRCQNTTEDRRVEKWALEREICGAKFEEFRNRIIIIIIISIIIIIISSSSSSSSTSSSSNSSSRVNTTLRGWPSKAL